jgi:hypothetical protein
LHNQWFIKEIKGEIKTFLEANENKYTTYQNLWDTMIVFLRGKFIAVNAYVTKTIRVISNNLNMHLKILEKEK